MTFLPLKNLGLSESLMIVASVVLILAGGVLQYGFVHGEVKRARFDVVDILQREIESAGTAIAEQAVLGDYASIEQSLESRVQRLDLREVRWIDGRGHELSAVSPPDPVQAPPWFVDWVGFPSIEKSMDLVVGGERYGTLVFFSDNTPLLNRVWSSFLDNLQVLMIGIGLLLIAIHTVINKALRSLGELTSGAARFGAGDYSLRINADGPPEIQATISSFNTMADSIQELLHSLGESNYRNHQLATIVEQSSEAIVGLDDQGCITSWNRGATRLYGYQPDEAIGRSRCLLIPNKLLAVEAMREEDVRQGMPVSVETQRTNYLGGIIDVELSMAPLRDDEGKVVGMVEVARDIGERKRASEALFAEKERAQVTLASIADAVITTDMSGRVEYLNPNAERLTGWSHEEARGEELGSVFMLVDEESGEPLPNPLDAILERATAPAIQESSTRAKALLVSRDDRRTPVEEAGAPIRDRDGKVIGVVLAFRDVGESRKLAQQLSWQASHDSLTGLVNRREFEYRLIRLVDDANSSDHEHTLMYIDLDQFKVVNDTCGHVAGDELLRQVATLLHKGMRASDTLARLGGDEFGVLLENCGHDQTVRIAENLLSLLSGFRFVWQDKAFNIGASFGVVAIAGGGQTLADVLGAADAACYSAKEKGRNRIQVFEPGDSDLARRHGEMHWVSRINHALNDNRIVLYLQPIVPVHDGVDDMPHFEVLMRLIDESGKVVPPMAFIPAAERYNLMPAIDRRVLSMTFAGYHEHFGRAAQGRAPMLSLNISGASFSDEHFLEFVPDLLRRHQVPPDSICFEITETAAIANLARATVFIREMKKLGCRFSLDDFGSGLSSFAYLKNLPVDYVKIDGGFVRDMANDVIDRTMVRSINDVGHAMGLRTIAEFVEDEETLALLREIGVDYAQGYGIGRPTPIAKIVLPRRASA